MSIGLCCQYLSDKNKNLCNEKRLQYGQFLTGKYSTNDILSTWYNNIDSLFYVLRNFIIPNGIKSFRISSNLLPLFDKVSLKEDKLLLSKLVKFGELVKRNNLRLTSHPDQFCVLNSQSQSVIDNSIKLLEYHSWIFDNMGLDDSPFYAINIHAGAANRLEQFVDTVNKLGRLKNRLTVENDELSYSVIDLLKVNQLTNIPIVFDSHHHALNNKNLSISDALDLCSLTWKNIKPLLVIVSFIVPVKVDFSPNIA
jgi:UV DNA damage endonuclease